ncbi:MAG: PilZ domain-containing protein [Desulfobacterales bacterium]
MKDELKTKSQLMEELEQMRRRVEELEAQIAEMEREKAESRRQLIQRQERKGLRANIEFITDFDIVDARGIDISEGGISFELYEELPFELRFELENRLHHYRANLVWVKRIPEGGFRFGLMFVRPPLSGDSF